MLSMVYKHPHCVSLGCHMSHHTGPFPGEGAIMSPGNGGAASTQIQTILHMVTPHPEQGCSLPAGSWEPANPLPWLFPFQGKGWTVGAALWPEDLQFVDLP